MDNPQGALASAWGYCRIVIILAAKDIVDAIKNKTTLTMVAGVALMLLTVQALPLLLGLDSRPRVAIYDADRTTMADELRQEGNLQVIELRTSDDTVTAVRESSGELLAIAMPEGWSRGEDALRLEAVVAHQVRTTSVDNMITATARALTEKTGRSVSITAGAVYPTLETGGHPSMVAMGLVLTVLLLTTILVPHLLLEEKAAHTLELLRVSPLSISQLVLGKGLAGMVYGILAGAMLLALNGSLVNQWVLMLSTLLLVAVLGVGLGLLVGSLAENEGAVQIWAVALTLALMVPLMLRAFGSSLPAGVRELVRWWPTGAAYDLARASFGDTWPSGLVYSRSAAILFTSALAYVATGWRLARWDK